LTPRLDCAPLGGFGFVGGRVFLSAVEAVEGQHQGDNAELKGEAGQGIVEVPACKDLEEKDEATDRAGGRCPEVNKATQAQVRSLRLGPESGIFLGANSLGQTRGIGRGLAHGMVIKNLGCT
jgi:hypothetical protein